ncbi:membralin-like protein At1g60995 [Spinacia oleracea]|uniref:Membralin-like protein At1g60995 n=1 Tax=Spinacia oleracea TaxID=3562 RepID=A0A9R0JIX4_SPIOL|nr:membralin-like protein At1g60995 [Spinacia oleracea]XP_021836100.2 membralin-like protein At1g60995 [Spinacia oleracea]XP_021836101.2 membralin-like protein At1g60995 [Spinacia oleracea]
MDPEQTFIRVQERFSQMVTPRIRAALEYFYLFTAVTLFAILVVMHANYVQQPGCSSELSGVKTSEAQLIFIKITGIGLLTQNDSEPNFEDISSERTLFDEPREPDAHGEEFNLFAVNYWFSWITSGAKRGKLDFKFWKNYYEYSETLSETTSDGKGSKLAANDGRIEREEPYETFSMFSKQSARAVILHFFRKWHRRLSFFWKHGSRLLGTLWNVAGINLNLDIPKWLRILHLDRLNLLAVQWLERKIKAFEPTYLYTMEKGYFLLPEEAKARHNVRTANISISARHPCFGNRWQQLLINRVVGYDTILMNSLLDFPGQGYLYNYQTKEFYNLSYAHEPSKSSATFGDYLVAKCGVLMMSLFVFFTTTMSVSFTLRETQTRMLKFTVQLQHHARHRLPTFQLIFVHVIESLVFVPIMIGILFFLFEFYDDQLLAFMVLILVWLCELFTLISVRTPISMKFFPRFFLLYFLVFHIYFFSYAYGFSYLALSTTAAFMLHLILYFWNRFEVPALQRFLQNRRSHMQQHPDFHITSSTILASTLHITRLNTRNPGSVNTEDASGPRVSVLRPGGGNVPIPPTAQADIPGLQEQLGNANRQSENTGREPLPIPENDLQQPETGQNPGNMNSFSSLLLWILGGASSESLNSFFSMFRDMRDQAQFYADSPRQENDNAENPQ